MKKVNVTFSVPKETIDLMNGLIGRRKLSAFVTIALNKALQEKVEDLRLAYSQAEVDPDRIKVIKDWSTIEGEDWSE